MTAYAVPRRLAFVVPDEVDAPTVFLMPLPDGPPVVLHDVSAVIWVLAADGEPDVGAAMRDVVGGDLTEMEEKVRTFLADLVDRGLLTHRGD
ncbi:hypothetical protein ACOCJ7_18105 [Knoellia sp. CPCC 206453]|uniref:hypothetical protein n=1 Tax=Knoellia pratensis TaxID=3404796 RepID=UPI003614177E